MSTVNERLAGVESMFPAESVARTSKVCGPSDSAAECELARPGAGGEGGRRRSGTGSWSRLRWRRSRRLGWCRWSAAEGPESIVVTGGVVSTVNERVAGVASVFRPDRWRGPRRCGCRQEVLRRMAAGAGAGAEGGAIESALEARAGLVGGEAEGGRGVVDDGRRGRESIVVSGGVVSTVNERLAGVESMFPAGSVARTSKVCGPSTAPRRCDCSSRSRRRRRRRRAGIGSSSRSRWRRSRRSAWRRWSGPRAASRSAVSGGVVSTVNERAAGVPSMFPAASVARTSKVWGPSDRAARACDCSPRSRRRRRRRRVGIGSSSRPRSEEKPKVGVASLVGRRGPGVDGRLGRGRVDRERAGAGWRRCCRRGRWRGPRRCGSPSGRPRAYGWRRPSRRRRRRRQSGIGSSSRPRWRRSRTVGVVSLVRPEGPESTVVCGGVGIDRERSRGGGARRCSGGVGGADLEGVGALRQGRRAVAAGPRAGAEGGRIKVGTGSSSPPRSRRSRTWGCCRW